MIKQPHATLGISPVPPVDPEDRAVWIQTRKRQLEQHALENELLRLAYWTSVGQIKYYGQDNLGHYHETSDARYLRKVKNIILYDMNNCITTKQYDHYLSLVPKVAERIKAGGRQQASQTQNKKL